MKSLLSEESFVEGDVIPELPFLVPTKATCALVLKVTQAFFYPFQATVVQVFSVILGIFSWLGASCIIPIFATFFKPFFPFSEP